MPVRQKAHFIAHPTCVEMQKVSSGESGMKTDSILPVVCQLEQELHGAVGRPVPVDDARDAETRKSSGSWSRSAFDRSVIGPKSVTPRLKTQR